MYINKSISDTYFKLGNEYENDIQMNKTEDFI